PRSPADEPQPASPDGAKIKDLQKERLATVHDMARIVEERLRGGQASLDDLREVGRVVLEAELDACGSDQERVDIFEKRLARAKDHEKMADQLAKAGQMRPSSALLVKADRLKAEVDLARAKAKLARQPVKENTSRDLHESIALAEKQVAIKQAGVRLAEAQKKMAVAKLSSVRAQHAEAEAPERFAQGQVRRTGQLWAKGGHSAG